MLVEKFTSCAFLTQMLADPTVHISGRLAVSCSTARQAIIYLMGMGILLSVTPSAIILSSCGIVMTITWIFSLVTIKPIVSIILGCLLQLLLIPSHFLEILNDAIQSFFSIFFIRVEEFHQLLLHKDWEHALNGGYCVATK